MRAGATDRSVDLLIVDDRADGLIALEAVLDFPGVRIIKAQSGREAIALAERHDFAVVLLDVQMPDLDGFETATLLRKNPRCRHTPIIFITAINKDDRYIYKGYEAGAVDYIFKPFESHVLRAKVSVFIELFLKSRQLGELADQIRESEKRERYLRLAELELESLKRYRTLADAIPHIVWKARPDGSIEYFNRIWTNYTGMPAEQSTGVLWQSMIDADDLKQFLKIWLRAMETNEPFETECRIRRSDGEMRWHWVRAVPELKDGTRLNAWLGTCTDIHDKKMTEVKLIEAERAASQANLAKTNFLANMSHEIRTPLGAILGFADLMLTPDQTAEERLRGISTIRKSGKQLLHLIDEILDISKVEAGHLEIEKIEVNLISLLSELKSLLNLQATAKGLELLVGLQTPIPEKIVTDPTRLRQILLNMVGNAIKFTARGKVEIQIGWKEPDQLQIRVKDTGLGIEKTEAVKLFKPFVQVDSSTKRRFGGTGLGLALSRQLARALGGNIELEESRLGSGSTFLIEISARRVDGAALVNQIGLSLEEPDLQVSSLVEKEALLLQGVSVLLVDDAPDNQFVIGTFLRAAGAHVDIASDGREGVSKALAGQHKIVLMDIQMPQLDGYEATAQLRLHGYARPIIALTAHALKEERDRCLNVGCSDHLTKPVERRDLIQQVAKYVKNSQMPEDTSFKEHRP